VSTTFEHTFGIAAPTPLNSRSRRERALEIGYSTGAVSRFSVTLANVA
jgi:hypothetical protein